VPVLLEKQFSLNYQAQVYKTGRIIGCEALVRWAHPIRAAVSPAEFIALAEETGLILPLGQWVLETACEQLTKWAAIPEATRLFIAVNVSVRQFRQTDFTAQVLSAINRAGANPKQLKAGIDRKPVSVGFRRYYRQDDGIKTTRHRLCIR